jgi:hypothetical protein
MKASMIVMALGWFFLIVALVWPSNKWGGYVIKIALSALSTGIFLANAVYAIMSYVWKIN